MDLPSYIEVHKGRPKLYPSAVVLLHGIGSNERSMVPLAAGIDPRIKVISVRSPLQLGANSFAWFPTQFTKDGPKMERRDGELARLTFRQFLSEFRQDNGLTDIYLMGFSQGCILSVVTGLTSPELVTGVVGWSGRFPPEFRRSVLTADRIRGVEFWVSHGTEDEKLSVNYGRGIRDLLEELHATFEYHEFPGSHTVTPQMLQAATAWLNQQVGKRYSTDPELSKAVLKGEDEHRSTWSNGEVAAPAPSAATSDN